MKTYAKSFKTLENAIETLSKNDKVRITFFDDLRLDFDPPAYRVKDLKTAFSKELFFRPVYAMYKQNARVSGCFEIILK
jgi:predicted AAA+ superfamily ATPase